MIVAKLVGGLGNQLFQFAAGRAAALRTGTLLAVDLRAYNHVPPSDTLRSYALGEFGITVREASRLDLFRMLGPNYLPYLCSRGSAGPLGRDTQTLL